MTNPDDEWPTEYRSGPTDHLHAIGVISERYNIFQSGIDALYKSCARTQKIPEKLINLFYFSLNDEKRLQALQYIFDEYEHEKSVRDAVTNLIEYFKWSKNCRDQIMHAERYPALFNDGRDVLNLTKRIGKTNPMQHYFSVTLPKLRDIADKIESGSRQCTMVRIYLRVRDKPATELPIAFRREEFRSLPEKLRVPRYLRLSPTPAIPPMPTFLK